MNNRDKASRFFASVLVIGGILGIAIAMMLGIQSYKRAGLAAIFLLVFTIPFIWSAYTGVRLWQGTSFGRKWAPVIYALQIPIIKIPGLLAYRWFTGFEFSPQVKFGSGDTFISFGLNFGANAQVDISPSSSGYLIGCNLFAVAALIFLLRYKGSLMGTRPPAQD